MSRSVRSVALVAFAFTLSIGCAAVPGGGRPLVLPTAARLGDTVAMALDSSYTPIFDAIEYHDLTRDNVSLEIRDGSTVLATIVDEDLAAAGEGGIIAVFDGLAADTRVEHALLPGWMLTAVLFNLPDALAGSPTLPLDVDVALVVDGVASTYVVGDLEITGSGGDPVDFYALSNPKDLEPDAMLRLRPFDDEDPPGFDPNWNIAGIEFTLEFLGATSAISNPQAYVGNEAHRASVRTGPETTPGSVRIAIVDPNGFNLPEPFAAGSYAGEGPIIDIIFDKVAGQTFDASDFTIRGLKVTDPDGALLSPPMNPTDDATGYFDLIVRANQP